MVTDSLQHNLNQNLFLQSSVSHSLELSGRSGPTGCWTSHGHGAVVALDPESLCLM